MSTILLADDSPHAQRMGERILREEGFEVSSVADEAGALACLAEGDPDLVIADAFLPGSGGLDLCRYIKKFHRHVRVILTAGQLESLNEEEAHAAGCDAVLRKPFEASLVIGTIRSLVHEAKLARGLFAEAMAAAPPAPVSDAAVSDLPAAARPAPPDPERIQAAITLALDAALPNLVREITEKVLVALGH
ncbi:MAG: response regulator receiver protein [Bryobacterales bacterium]|jgi:CheY-like chemotaxis protein|nr:response regulator receiver protein [Bryobacterales bacterium]